MQDPRSSVRAGAMGGRGGRGGSNIDRSKYKSTPFISNLTSVTTSSSSSSSPEGDSPTTSTNFTDIETTSISNNNNNNNDNNSIRNTNQEVDDLNQTNNNNINNNNNNLKSHSGDNNNLIYKVDSHDVLSVASNDSYSSSLSASISSSVLLPMDSLTSSDFVSSFTITARVPQKMTPKTIQKKLPLISNLNNNNNNNSLKSGSSNNSLNVSISGIANNNNSNSFSNGSIHDLANAVNNNNSSNINSNSSNNNFNSSSISTPLLGSSSSAVASSSSVAMIYNNRPLPTPIVKTEIDKIDTQNQVKTLRELFNREESSSSSTTSSSSLITNDFKQTPFKNYSSLPSQPQTLPLPRSNSHHLSLMLSSSNNNNNNDNNNNNNHNNFTSSSYTDENIDMKGSYYQDVVTPAKRPSYNSTQSSSSSTSISSITSIDFNLINKIKSFTPGGPVVVSSSSTYTSLKRPNSLYMNQNNINAINNINHVITNNIINNNNILLNTRSSTGNDIASRCAVVLNISKTEFLALEPEPPVIDDQYTYKELVRRNYRKEYDDLIQSNLEQYLTDEEFMIVFGRTKVKV